MDERLIERVAVELASNDWPPEVFGKLSSGERKHYSILARAAIAAVFDALEPSGDMLQVGNRAWLDGENEAAIWRVMLAQARKEALP